MTTRREREKQYYVEPKVFRAAMEKYYKSSSDEMLEYLSELILKIAKGLSLNKSFKGYPFVEEMVGDAVIKMYAALKYKKYDLNRGTNPFSYFNAIARNEFVSRIKKEKKYRDTLKEYKEVVYDSIMTDPSQCPNGFIYVKPKCEFDNESPDDE